MNYLCRAPLLQSKRPRWRCRIPPGEDLPLNLKPTFFFSLGLQTDFEVPWDSAATQWVCGDWSGSHIFTAGREISPWRCLGKNKHCRLTNKSSMNTFFPYWGEILELSMCGMSFIALIAMATVQTNIRNQWDMKLSFLYCENTIQRCISCVCTSVARSLNDKVGNIPYWHDY